MAAGDPVNVLLTGCTLLLTAETGCIIQSHNRSVSSSRVTVFNAAVGYDMGFIAFNFVASISCSAIVNGTTGLAIAAPGVVLTLANDFGIGTAKNGVATGGVYTDSVDISHQGENLRMISINATQRAGIA